MCRAVFSMNQKIISHFFLLIFQLIYDLWNLTCSFNSIWEEANVKSIIFSQPHGHGSKILTIKGSWCNTPFPQCYYVDVKVKASKVNTIRNQRKQRSSYTLIKKETWKWSCVIRKHIIPFVLDVLSFSPSKISCLQISRRDRCILSWITIALRCSDLPTINSIALVKNKRYKKPWNACCCSVYQLGSIFQLYDFFSWFPRKLAVLRSLFW